MDPGWNLLIHIFLYKCCGFCMTHCTSSKAKEYVFSHHSPPCILEVVVKFSSVDRASLCIDTDLWTGDTCEPAGNENGPRELTSPAEHSYKQKLLKRHPPSRSFKKKKIKTPKSQSSQRTLQTEITTKHAFRN